MVINNDTLKKDQFIKEVKSFFSDNYKQLDYSLAFDDNCNTVEYFKYVLNGLSDIFMNFDSGLVWLRYIINFNIY